MFSQMITTPMMCLYYTDTPHSYIFYSLFIPSTKQSSLLLHLFTLSVKHTPPSSSVHSISQSSSQLCIPWIPSPVTLHDFSASPPKSLNCFHLDWTNGLLIKHLCDTLVPVSVKSKREDKEKILK